MAEEVVALVASTATLPIGTGIVFDAVTIGASTGKVEYVKLMSGSSGSTVTVPASSAALGAVGLNVSVTNSTANAVGVKAQDSTVSIAGNVNVTFSTASTGSVIVANTTAAAVPTRLTLNSTLVSTAQPLPVLLQDSTATVTIQGNSTALISSASIIKVDTIGAFPANSSLVVINAAVPQSSVTLSTAGAGGSSGNPVYVLTKPFSLVANSTWASLKVTSTANSTIFSSAASTRFCMTDLVLTNAGSAECVATIYDGSTTGTKLFWTDLASAGGGVSIQFAQPRRTTTGLAMIIETVPASSVYVNVGAYRSS